MLELKGIYKWYNTGNNRTFILKDIDLSMKEGEFISIMGPSGSGKSTLLNVIGLLDVPTGGKVYINGKQITSYRDKALARVRNA